MPALIIPALSFLCLAGLTSVTVSTSTIGRPTTFTRTATDLSVLFNETVAVHQKICSIGPNCERLHADAPHVTIPPTVSFDGGDRLIDATVLSGDFVECCGSCSCEDSCFTYGTCCLQKYNDFMEARYGSENTRATCVTSEYIIRRPAGYKSPQSSWMVTKCNHEDIAEDIKEKCREPRFDSSFESLTPVTDVSSNESYRNTFCAQCNTEANPAYLRSWDINIVCDGALQLPDKNILASMYQQNCSIIFKNLPNTESQTCKNTLISSCNETGQWQDYDEMINLACNSFLDPFNYTYKNYFCYLCNTRNESPADKFSCSNDTEVYDFTPGFATIIDLDVIRRWENNEILYCDEERQFEDYNLMQCRDIHCFDARYLAEDICRNKVTFKDKFCYSMFIKVTLLDNWWLINENFRQEYFLKNLLEFHKYDNALPFIPYVAETAATFLDEESLEVKNGSKYVRHFYLHFLLNMPVFNKKDVLETFYELYGLEPKIYDREIRLLGHGPRYEFKLTTRSLNISEITSLLMNTGHVLVNGLHAIHVEELDILTCTQKQLVTFTKIKICPFIKVKFDELSMAVRKNILIVNVSKTRFSVTDYEKHGNEIYICVEDYKAISKHLPPVQIVRSSNPRVVVDVKDIFLFVCFACHLCAFL